MVMQNRPKHFPSCSYNLVAENKLSAERLLSEEKIPNFEF